MRGVEGLGGCCKESLGCLLSPQDTTHKKNKNKNQVAVVGQVLASVFYYPVLHSPPHPHLHHHIFQDRVSLCSSGYSGIHYVKQACFELIGLPVSASHQD